MKNLILLTAAAVWASALANPLLQPRGCNADNCARQVTGSNVVEPIEPTRLADCSSFMAVTVIPPAVTNTMTMTAPFANLTQTTVVASTAFVNGSTSTIFIGDSVPFVTVPTPSASAPVIRRQADSSLILIGASTLTGAQTVIPTRVPEYAMEPCSGAFRYSSACSCWGIPMSTSTALPLTVLAFTTVTPTLTLTQTSTLLTTSTQLAIQTVLPGVRPQCGSVVQGTNGCRCQYAIQCGQIFMGGRIIQTLNMTSEMDCVHACDGFDNCFNADYSRVSGQCRIFERALNLTTAVGDDVYAFAGACGATSRGPNCVTG